MKHLWATVRLSTRLWLNKGKFKNDTRGQGIAEHKLSCCQQVIYSVSFIYLFFVNCTL